MTTYEDRVIERRLSDDGTRWVIIERWTDYQMSPPRRRSKNRTVKLSKADLAYFAERNSRAETNQ